jgi:hypothetical protein
LVYIYVSVMQCIFIPFIEGSHDNSGHLVGQNNKKILPWEIKYILIFHSAEQDGRCENPLNHYMINFTVQFIITLYFKDILC